MPVVPSDRGAIAVVLAAGLLIGCGMGGDSIQKDDAAATERPRRVHQRGLAAWYGGRFHGRKTASGERFDKNAMTAAHKKLRFGTVVRVVNTKNGRAVEVRITDRGPYGKGRVIDVSEAAAKRLGMIKAGVVPVTIEIVSRP